MKLQEKILQQAEQTIESVREIYAEEGAGKLTGKAKTALEKAKEFLGIDKGLNFEESLEAIQNYPDTEKVKQAWMAALR